MHNFSRNLTLGVLLLRSVLGRAYQQPSTTLASEICQAQRCGSQNHQQLEIFFLRVAVILNKPRLWQLAPWLFCAPVLPWRYVLPLVNFQRLTHFQKVAAPPPFVPGSVLCVVRFVVMFLPSPPSLPPFLGDVPKSLCKSLLGLFFSVSHFLPFLLCLFVISVDFSVSKKVSF